MSENIDIRNIRRNRKTRYGKLPLNLPQPRIRYRSSRYNFRNQSGYDEETDKSVTLLRNMVICAVIILLVVILKSIDTPFCRSVLEYVRGAVTTEFDIDDTLGKLKFVDNWIPDNVKAVFSDQTAKKELRDEVDDILKQLDIKFSVPAEGKVIAFFGEPKGEKGKELNNGIDVQGNQNDNIYAVYDGYVTAIGEDEISGKYIEINQGNNIVTLYTGCSEFAVNVGERVKKGQMIGKMGQTNEGTRVVHFETWISGKPVDPLLLMDLGE